MAFLWALASDKRAAWSDAFFPATDSIERAAQAGIAIIIQPGGSLKDKDIIKACEQSNIKMLFTGQRCFKH
jgi:phosphoribosylaminoimidazolecarboxamide formyltransferase